MDVFKRAGIIEEAFLFLCFVVSIVLMTSKVDNCNELSWSLLSIPLSFACIVCALSSLSSLKTTLEFAILLVLEQFIIYFVIVLQLFARRADGDVVVSWIMIAAVPFAISFCSGLMFFTVTGGGIMDWKSTFIAKCLIDMTGVSMTISHFVIKDAISGFFYIVFTQLYVILPIVISKMFLLFSKTGKGSVTACIFLITYWSSFFLSMSTPALVSNRFDLFAVLMPLYIGSIACVCMSVQRLINLSRPLKH